MAFPVVQARTVGATTAVDTTSHVVTLPAGIVAGELLLVVFSVDGNPTCTASAGWTKLGQASNTTVVTGAVFWKIATGGDTLTVTTSVAEQSSWGSLRISGANSVFGTSSNGSSTNSDPPSFTAGTDDDHLWVVTRSGDSTVQPTNLPGGMVDAQTIAGAGANSASTATAEYSATRLLTVDPNPWTVATEQWVCWTIQVQPPVVAGPKMSTLADTFDTAVNPAVWTSSGTTGWDASGKRAAVTELSSNYSRLISAIAYDLTESALFAKVTPPAAYTNSTETVLAAKYAGGPFDPDGVYILIVGESGPPALVFRLRQGAANDETYNMSYDPVAHAYLRIRHSGSTLYWDTSPDGSTWTNQRTKGSVTLGLTSVYAELQVGQWSAQATQQPGYFDNVNTVPAAAGGRPKVYTAGSWQKKPAKVYNGSAWVEKPWKVWTGSTWKVLT